MTEHAVNNGSSICQTAEATHLILTFRDFCANKTLGFSYSGQRAELEFHLVSDPKPEIRLSLYVRNISKRQWNVLTYADPFKNYTDHNTDTEVKELPPNEDVFLYSISELSFGNRDELIIYIRFDRDAVMLQAPEVEREQLEYMWSRLQLLLEDSHFADMRVNGLPAHRAVLAAASGPLHETISALTRSNQSSKFSATHDVCKTLKHSNVDNENVNRNPMEEGQQNDVKPQYCSNDDTVDVKTNNDDPPGCNSIQQEQIADLDKIAEDGNESLKERKLQNSDDSQHKEIVENDSAKFNSNKENKTADLEKIAEDTKESLEKRKLQNSDDSQNNEEIIENDSAGCNSTKGDQTAVASKIAEDTKESLEERNLQNSDESQNKEEIVENYSAKCNSNKENKTFDLAKIAVDTKEERKLQNSCDSQNNEELVEKESTSGLKRDSNMVSKTSEDAIAESSKRTENIEFITAETVEDTKDYRTEDIKIPVSQLMKFFENHLEEHFSLEQVTSMFNNFPIEHVEVEEMERPHPDNYQLEIFQLRSKTNTERFLEYIYTKSCVVTDEKKFLIDLGEDLITVARLYDLENLERVTELQICEEYLMKDTEEILHLACLYDLYTLKRTAILYIRWSFMDYLQDPLGKYILMPNHRYQTQCLVTFKVPKITKLMGSVTSELFYVCGCALQVKVTKQSNTSNSRCYEINLVQTKGVPDVIFNINTLVSDKDNETLTLFGESLLMSLHYTPEIQSFQLIDIPAGGIVIVDDTIEFVFFVDSEDEGKRMYRYDQYMGP